MRIKGDDTLLIIQPLVGIGDMIWHKPWIDQLIALNKVVLATKASSMPYSLFNDCLDKIDIVEIDRNIRGQKGRHDGVFGLLRLSRAFKQTGAKRALILHHSQSYLRAAKLASIPEIAGFGFGKAGFSSKTLSASDRHIHAIAKMEKLWSLNGWQAPLDGWHLAPKQSAIASAKRHLESQNVQTGQMLILGIGAMHEDRCWPADKFANLITHLRTQRPDLIPVIMGGPAEVQIADDIQKQLADPVADCFLSFDEAIAALSLAKGYIGNDTSLLNAAAVLGVDSLGLFSQSPPLTYVKNLHHLDVIGKDEYGLPGIIHKIEVDDIMKQMSTIWPQSYAVR